VSDLYDFTKESGFRSATGGGGRKIGIGAAIMLNHKILISVAEQMMSGTQVEVNGRKSRVSRTGAMRLRTTRFLMEGKEYQAIEQNAEKPSRWGKLARDGHRVVQFRDLASQQYVAVVFDQKVQEYSR